MRATHIPPPRAVDPNFQIVESGRQLPGYCYAEFVATNVGALLAAFNDGRGRVFAGGFARPALFTPYNGHPSQRFELRSRAAIAAFVTSRHRAGDGWTETQLTAPASASPTGVGIFGVMIRVRTGVREYIRGAKVVIACATGSITTWRGPAWA